MIIHEVSFSVWRNKDALTFRVYVWVVTTYMMFVFHLLYMMLVYYDIHDVSLV